MHYVRFIAPGDLPGLAALRPFKAIVVVEEVVPAQLREAICEWLVSSGCLYLMAWGDDCSAWVEAIERANRAVHDSDEIPDDSVIIATAHGDETLEQVFWFSKYTAMHPCAELETTVLVHVAETGREQEFSAAFAQA